MLRQLWKAHFTESSKFIMLKNDFEKNHAIFVRQRLKGVHNVAEGTEKGQDFDPGPWLISTHMVPPSNQ